MTKKCPSCFILHLPSNCSGEKPPATEIKKGCASCFISHTPSECGTISLVVHTKTVTAPPQCLFRGELALDTSAPTPKSDGAYLTPEEIAEFAKAR